MNIKATHEIHGMLFGTIQIIELPDDIVFVLTADDAPWGDIERKTDSHWARIEAPTLSELVTECERQGLSDIEPVCEL